MTSFWCELAWLGGEQPEAGVAIETDEGVISEVVHDVAAAPAGARRLVGLTLPGLANAHSHAFQRALRGRTQRHLGGSFWSWRGLMYELAEAVDIGTFESLARATFAEMALAGVSVVGEFHYMHDGDNAFGEAAIRAANDAGIRITLIDACYLHGGVERFRDASASAWAKRVGALSAAGHARLGAAIHSVRAVDPEGARTVAAVAAEHGWPLHAHVSEQPAENEECERRYGASPTTVLARAGAVDARFTAIHATHLNNADVALLGSAGACCCICPTTERDLADGVGQARRLADAGAPLALGTDSHAAIDLFEEARAVELDERLATGVRGLHSPTELARAATAGGYASVGWPEGGRIEPGALADFVTVSLDGPRLAGTQPGDALDAVIFAATAADVRGLVVGGREVVRDGAHVDLDVPAELAHAIAAASR